MVDILTESQGDVADKVSETFDVNTGMTRIYISTPLLNLFHVVVAIKVEKSNLNKSKQIGPYSDEIVQVPDWRST